MTFSKEQRIKIYSKYNGKCAYCGCDILLNNMQIDHVIPQRNFEWHIKNRHFKVPDFLKHLTIDDLNNEDNLLPSCRVCNGWKSTSDLELFRSELEVQTKRLNERSSNYRIAKKYGLIEEINNPIIFYFEEKKSPN